MQVKLKTTMAGPSGTANAGTVIEVSDDEGRELLEGGYAVFVAPTAAVPTEAEEPSESPQNAEEPATAPEAGDNTGEGETGEQSGDGGPVIGEAPQATVADPFAQLNELFNQQQA